MTTNTASARLYELFPGVAAAKVELDAHRETKPIHADNDPGWKDWVEQSKALRAAYDRAWKATKGFICQRCGGNGHWFASNNRPVPCQCGDGWTAKGRKLRDAK